MSVGGKGGEQRTTKPWLCAVLEPARLRKGCNAAAAAAAAEGLKAERGGREEPMQRGLRTCSGAGSVQACKGSLAGVWGVSWDEAEAVRLPLEAPAWSIQVLWGCCGGALCKGRHRVLVCVHEKGVRAEVQFVWLSGLEVMLPLYYALGKPSAQNPAVCRRPHSTDD